MAIRREGILTQLFQARWALDIPSHVHPGCTIYPATFEEYPGTRAPSPGEAFRLKPGGQATRL